MALTWSTRAAAAPIIVPLNPDDPLYEPGAPTNFMMLDRATNRPGPDGVIGTADDEREHENRTTPWVDQNQTYTSHPSHHVFIREYELVDGVPQATGRLLNGADQDGDGQGDGLATWNDVKAQARNILGIDLTDDDVLAVPQVLVDYYGNFTPDAERPAAARSPTLARSRATWPTRSTPATPSTSTRRSSTTSLTVPTPATSPATTTSCSGSTSSPVTVAATRTSG